MMFESTEPTPELYKELLLRSLKLNSAQPVSEEPSDEDAQSKHVAIPASLIAIHGELDHRLRYAYNAATPSANAEQLKAIRELKRELDLLPAATIEAIRSTDYEGWLSFYKGLIRVHQLCINAKLFLDLEEYESTLRLLTQLAQELVDASCARFNAASIFSLMLLESHMAASTKKKRRVTYRTQRSRRK